MIQIIINPEKIEGYYYYEINEFLKDGRCSCMEKGIAEKDRLKSAISNHLELNLDSRIPAPRMKLTPVYRLIACKCGAVLRHAAGLTLPNDPMNPYGQPDHCPTCNRLLHANNYTVIKD